jgi:hypothetical protein
VTRHEDGEAGIGDLPREAATSTEIPGTSCLLKLHRLVMPDLIRHPPFLRKVAQGGGSGMTVQT